MVADVICPACEGRLRVELDRDGQASGECEFCGESIAVIAAPDQSSGSFAPTGWGRDLRDDDELVDAGDQGWDEDLDDDAEDGEGFEPW
jgi:hypothetical protein